MLQDKLGPAWGGRHRQFCCNGRKNLSRNYKVEVKSSDSEVTAGLHSYPGPHYGRVSLGYLVFLKLNGLTCKIRIITVNENMHVSNFHSVNI